MDVEGRFYLPEVLVLNVDWKEMFEGRKGFMELEEEVAQKLPEILNSSKIAVVKGHGSFAVGETLEEAFHWTSALEHSCKIIYLKNTAGL